MKPIAILLFLGTSLLTFPTLASNRPNIIVMMADDMGFSDIGCYGGEIHTPNLNRLAENGLRFTQFYNTARCCPTRASLLTGLYPHQAGVGHMMEDKGLESYQGNLSDHCVTIAEVLSHTGYRTYMSGKWHVSRYTHPTGPKENWPLQRGFDRFFGTIHGAGSFYDPNSLTLDNTQIAPWKDFYYTDAISDYSVRWIQEHPATHPDQPFFLYVAYTSPHWPMHAKPEDIARYHGRYDAGWDAIRQERYQRQKDLGIIHPEWPLSPRDPAVPSWKDEPMKSWEARCMEVYAAMVDTMDQGIGRIIAALEKTGQLDNTLILFLADNGGCAEGMSRERSIPAPSPILRQPMLPGELQTKMIPDFTRDGLPVRLGMGVIPGPADTYVAYGRAWANASNTPFREYKHWVHEGGISSPLIAHWPKGIAANQTNTWETQPAHLIDLMATCVDLGQASYPTLRHQKSVHPMAGTSLSPTFSGKSLDRHQPLFWEHEGNKAIRQGPWKLVAKHRQPWELFNLENDRTEQTNLAERHPEKVKEMELIWQKWATKSGVEPWPLK